MLFFCRGYNVNVFSITNHLAHFSPAKNNMFHYTAFRYMTTLICLFSSHANFNKKHGFCSTDSNKICLVDGDCESTINDGKCVLFSGRCSVTMRLTCDEDLECPILCCPSNDSICTFPQRKLSVQYTSFRIVHSLCFQELCIHNKRTLTSAIAQTDEPTITIMLTNEETSVVNQTNVPTIAIARANEPTNEILQTNEPTSVIQTDGPTIAQTNQPSNAITQTSEPSSGITYPIEPKKKNQKAKKDKKKRQKKKKKEKKEDKQKTKKKKKKKKKKKASPTASPVKLPLSYEPGDLTVDENGLKL